jgi:glycosyltransferase involved in cell wall biosynthesis
MNDPGDPALSIIIPAYNEESRLPRALAKIRDYLAGRRCGPEQVEIIIVDDGSVNGTAAVAERSDCANRLDSRLHRRQNESLNVSRCAQESIAPVGQKLSYLPSRLDGRREP